jgi:hypothetical protein
MKQMIKNFMLTRWVTPLSPQVFVKNPSAPGCVAVKGIAINGDRRQGLHIGISHKSMFNCGF